MSVFAVGLVPVLLWFGPASADATRIGVAPIEVEGDVARDLSDPAGERLQATIAGEYDAVDVSAASPCDDACLASAARAAGVPAVVQVRITVESRDYTLRTRVVDANTGEVLRNDENTCEICTYDESLEVLDQQLANVSGALHKLLDNSAGEVAPLEVTSRPPGAEVRVDGKVVGTTPFSGPVPVGDHELSVVRDGYLAESKSISLLVGEGQQHDFKLRKVSGSRALQIAGWSMVGLGLAAVAGGAALIAIDENPHKSSCNGDSVDVNGTCEFRYDTLAGGVGLLVGGVAVAGGGATMIIVDRRGRKRATATAAVSPRGVSIRGRF